MNINPQEIILIIVVFLFGIYLSTIMKSTILEGSVGPMGTECLGETVRCGAETENQGWCLPPNRYDGPGGCFRKKCPGTKSRCPRDSDNPGLCKNAIHHCYNNKCNGKNRKRCEFGTEQEGECKFDSKHCNAESSGDRRIGGCGATLYGCCPGTDKSKKDDEGTNCK